MERVESQEDYSYGLADFLARQFPGRQVMFRQLASADYPAFLAMQTGISHDYITDIFPEAVNHEATYGIFVDNQLIAMGAITRLADHYAILGRVRTDDRYRRQGVSTACLQELTHITAADPTIQWIGLATEVDNHSMRRVAEKLPFAFLGAYQSCSLSQAVMSDVLQAMTDHDDTKQHWQRITDTTQKHHLLTRLKSETRDLPLFPYDCYYPLPYEADVWHGNYLESVIFYKNKIDSNVAMATEDGKGWPYLQWTYFGADLFEKPGLWQVMIQHAQTLGYDIWFELPIQTTIPDKLKPYLTTNAWTYYGKHLPQKATK